MSRRPSVLHRPLLGGLLALTTHALPAQTAPYSILDRIEGDWINRNPVPIRPMVLMPSNVDLWAVNAYASTVNRIDPTLTVVQSFRTLPGPVSIARYQPQVGNDRLLVVCQHVNAVAVHDAVNGDMVGLHKVKAQPGDILVDQANRRAWVSCPGADQVVEIDLQAPGNPQTVYTVAGKHPTFLSFLGSEVLVAARISGNGSVVHRKAPPPAVNPDAGSKGILDTLNPAVATQGLPDNDVFWLDRATGSAFPVVKNAGTLLFAHAVKPGTTNELWLLNTDANNKNPLKQTEHAIRGEVVFNRLSRILVPNLVAGVTPVVPFATNFLDDSDNNPANGIQYNNATAVGTPYSLVFAPNSGFALAAGLLTSNIAVLDGAGNNVYQWTLPAGAMPRQLLVDQTETFAIAWGGDNRVHVYAFGTLPPTLLASVSLGFDPTPPAIRDGRRIFHDASHSLHNNASCASCHDEGKTDMLPWNLSNISELITPNDGKDNKGPMITQTLVGIDKSIPFHWRGEQLNGLIDFNPAFDNLLGGTQLAVGPGSDFEKFAAFILSLTEDANQFQDASRVLNNNIQPPLPSGSPLANAINGQSLFGTTCAGGCHTLPAGTSNDMIPDGVLFSEVLPKRQWTDIAAFHGMQFKGMQPLANVIFNPATGLGTEAYPISGSGLTHAGLINDLNHFLSFFFVPATGPHADSVSFMFQFDTGQAPAVHGATLLTRPTAAAAASFVQNYLMVQANLTNRNCDVVAFGMAQVGAGLAAHAWVLERAGGQFRRDDNVLQPFSFFTGQVASVPGTWFAFAGVPVGTGRGFAIDFDRDQLPNLLECASVPGSQFIVDSDLDGFWDGHEWLNGSNWCSSASVPTDNTVPRLSPAAPAFQWVSGKTARLTFETDELSTCTVVLTPTNPAAPVVTLASSAPGLQHNLLASTLLMGTTYNCSLTAVDLVGNATPLIAMPQISTMGTGDLVAIMDNLAWSSPPSGGGGTWTFPGTARVAAKGNGAPPPPVQGVMVVARAMVNGIPATASQYLAGSTPGFDVVNSTSGIIVPYTGLAGPFVISPVPSNALGDVTLSFTLGGLVTGDKVELVIESAGAQEMSIPSPPTMINFLPPGTGSSNLPVSFSFPNTPAPFRSISFVIP